MPLRLGGQGRSKEKGQHKLDEETDLLGDTWKIMSSYYITVHLYPTM